MLTTMSPSTGTKQSAAKTASVVAVPYTGGGGVFVKYFRTASNRRAASFSIGCMKMALQTSALLLQYRLPDFISRRRDRGGDLARTETIDMDVAGKQLLRRRRRLVKSIEPI